MNATGHSPRWSTASGRAFRMCDSKNASGGRVPPRAFTLVEVLVSLAIFAIAAVVLGTAYVNVLLNYDAMRKGSSEKSDIAFARSTLLAEPVRTEAERGGQMTTAGGGTLRWHAEIREASRADLFQVALDFEIAAPGQAATRHTRENFLLLRPTWSEPAKRDQLRAAFRDELAKRKF